jgi:hypothetical protein
MIAIRPAGPRNASRYSIRRPRGRRHRPEKHRLVGWGFHDASGDAACGDAAQTSFFARRRAPVGAYDMA